jgi:hypothetical protein
MSSLPTTIRQTFADGVEGWEIHDPGSRSSPAAPTIGFLGDPT